MGSAVRWVGVTAFLSMAFGCRWMSAEPRDDFGRVEALVPVQTEDAQVGGVLMVHRVDGHLRLGMRDPTVSTSRWDVDTGLQGALMQPPRLVGGMLLLLIEDDEGCQLAAFDGDEGTVRWRQAVGQCRARGTVLHATDAGIWLSRLTADPPGVALQAWDPQTGQAMWSLDLGRDARRGDLPSQLTVVGEHLFVEEGDSTEVVVSLTGESLGIFTEHRGGLTDDGRFCTFDAAPKCWQPDAASFVDASSPVASYVHTHPLPKRGIRGINQEDSTTWELTWEAGWGVSVAEDFYRGGESLHTDFVPVELVRGTEADSPDRERSVRFEVVDLTTGVRVWQSRELASERLFTARQGHHYLSALLVTMDGQNTAVLVDTNGETGEVRAVQRPVTTYATSLIPLGGPNLHLVGDLLYAAELDEAWVVDLDSCETVWSTKGVGETSCLEMAVLE